MGFPQPAAGFYMPNIPQPQRFFNPNAGQAGMGQMGRGGPHQGVPHPVQQPRWGPQHQGGPRAHHVNMSGNPQFRPRPGGPGGARMGQPTAGMGPRPHMQVPVMRQGMPPQPMMQAAPAGMRPNQQFKYNQGVRNPPVPMAQPGGPMPGQPQAPQAAVLIQGQVMIKK